MKTVQCIQYAERFTDDKQASEILASLKNLSGFLGGRVTRSPDIEYVARPFVCQAFFDCYEDINPNSVSSCHGLRIVHLPLDMLANINRDNNP